jgi:hypothetical protein
MVPSRAGEKPSQAKDQAERWHDEEKQRETPADENDSGLLPRRDARKAQNGEDKHLGQECGGRECHRPEQTEYDFSRHRVSMLTMSAAAPGR